MQNPLPDSLVEIPWGNKTLSFHLPEHWGLLGIMRPAPISPPEHIQQEIEHSLAESTGMPTLAELEKPGKKIALVIDDDSRPTPVSMLLPAVLAEIQRGGATLDQVTVVPATGVHFPMKSDGHFGSDRQIVRR